METRNYFPLGKAYGDAFCNREEETEALLGNLLVGKHTFLVAPRRYGKSSLAEKSITKSKLPWAKIDFHLAVREKDAERLILVGVMDLIGKAISRIDKMTAQIKSFAKTLQPKFSLGGEHLSLELSVSSGSLPSENVAEALSLLEKLLQENDKKAVLLMDEFQEVGELSNGHGIEGAIRSIAQETRNLSIIFSGSNPHLIKNMFQNSRRPLYKLCKRMVIHRISQEHYRKHLNKAADKAWGGTLPDDVFSHIMLLTDQHPYYVNLICDQLWSNKKMPASTAEINNAWKLVVEGERSDLVKDFLSLSDNQRIVLMHLVNHGGENLTSGKMLTQMEMPLSSVNSAALTLEEKDFIEKRDGIYHLIIPAYRYILGD